MKHYIRFDENGVQIEAAALLEKPNTAEWKAAPKNFAFNKRYRLSTGGTVEEIPQSELETEQLNAQKTLILQELSRIVDNARTKYVGISPAKRKCYELQEKAANAVINNPEPDITNSLFSWIIRPLANVRNIGILDMAELILEKAHTSNQKIIEAEAIEDEYKILIKNAENTGQISGLITEVLNKLEAF
jgi:hypothetical protein